MPSETRIELVNQLLDKQLVDRHHHKMGKVDEILIELREGAPPRVAWIEVGAVPLARRVAHWLGRWVEAAERRWGPRAPQPFRIPWSMLRHIGISAKVDMEAEGTMVMAWEEWLSRHVVGRIPGSGVEQ